MDGSLARAQVFILCEGLWDETKLHDYMLVRQSLCSSACKTKPTYWLRDSRCHQIVEIEQRVVEVRVPSPFLVP